MRKPSKIRIIGAVIAAGIIVGGVALTAPKPRVTSQATGPEAWRVALQVLNGDFTFDFTPDSPVAEADPTPVPTPTPNPTVTPRPTTTPAPTASPCPDTINISSTGPGSEVHVTCSGTTRTNIYRSSNVSVSSSSVQTSTGGSNHSTSNTSISITND